jgi:hypothetical protein
MKGECFSITSFLNAGGDISGKVPWIGSLAACVAAARAQARGGLTGMRPSCLLGRVARCCLSELRPVDIALTRAQKANAGGLQHEAIEVSLLAVEAPR